MKFTSFTVSRGATVNVGNYSSERIEVTAVVEVGEKDNHEEVFERALAWVQAKVRREVLAIGDRFNQIGGGQ